MKIVGIIPARYLSTRLPGKPLADICGKPMIWWVYRQVMQVSEIDEIYVATEDERVADVCNSYGMNVIMTQDNHVTGMDRVAEVAQKVTSDIYVQVQGDEPLIEPEVILNVIKTLGKREDLVVSNAITPMYNPVDVTNSTTPKAVVDKNNRLIYISRSPIPYPKGRTDITYYKHVGVYAFRPPALDLVRKTTRGPLESAEDTEMMRLVELHQEIPCCIVNTQSIAVDTAKDLNRVCLVMSNRDKEKAG